MAQLGFTQSRDSSQLIHWSANNEHSTRFAVLWSKRPFVHNKKKAAQVADCLRKHQDQ